MIAQGRQCLFDLIGAEVALDGRPHAALGDRLRTGWVELGVGGVLRVAHGEDDLVRLIWCQLQAHVMAADGLPAMGHRVRRRALFHDGRSVPAAVGSQEGIALGVEPGQRLRTCEPGEVVAAFAVLGLVVDDVVFDLHLADRVVALEVGGIVQGVPEVPFDRAEERQPRGCIAFVGDAGAPNLQRLAQRHEVRRLGADAVAARADDRVAQPVAALVVLDEPADRLPAGTPVVAGEVVTQVQVAAADIEGRVVVAVARQAAQAGIAIERVTAGGVGDEAQVVLGPQVVDPGQRRIRSRDDVLAPFVIEPSVSHPCLLRTGSSSAALLVQCRVRRHSHGSTVAVAAHEKTYRLATISSSNRLMARATAVGSTSLKSSARCSTPASW